MSINPFHGRATRLAEHRAEQTEHEAAVELLVFAEFADHLITIDEQIMIEAFTDSHGWDSPTFSYETYHRNAIAKIRGAIGSSERENALLRDISARVTDAELRRELTSAVSELLPYDNAVNADLANRIRNVFTEV